MSVVSIKEMLENSHDSKNEFMIDNFLLNNTSVVISAQPKIGKTTLVLQLLNAICNDTNFLDIKKGSYNVDTIIFYSNDSTESSIKIKLQKMSFNENDKKVHFIFDKTKTVDELIEDIKNLVTKEERVLLVVDVLSGLRMKNQFDINNYTSMSDVIDYLEEHLKSITNKFGVVIIHHLNKKGSALGSTAIESRVSAKMKMTTDEFATEFAKLNIDANDYQSRNIYIRQDKKRFRWIIDKEQNSVNDSDVDYQLLRINEAITRSEKNFISGSINEVIALTKVTISPRRFTKFLKKNKRYFKQNNIEFTIRKSNTTIIDLYFKN